MPSRRQVTSDTEETAGAATDALASDHDAAGVPVHRGWAPMGGRHRWMEPFVLVVLATTGAHGYAITGELEEMGITSGTVDVGQVYRILRDLEASGQVTSAWSNEPVGPQRREYELTAAGYAARPASMCHGRAPRRAAGSPGWPRSRRSACA